MILSIRKQIKRVVATLLFIFLQTYSVEVYALTSGPAQEEYASFEPVGTTDMVNLYTGDFTYNIPLLSVPGPNGGYPINLAYHSGIGMDQEASWVGLGWNVNVGAVNRNLRGLPDDFDGDLVEHEQHTRKNWTFGLELFKRAKEKVGFNVGEVGVDLTNNATMQIYYNNYKGLGYRVKYNPQFTAGPVNLGLSMSYDPHEGAGVGASLNVGASFSKEMNASVGVSGSWNSRQGLQGISLTGKLGKNFKHANLKGSSSMTFNFRQGVPAVTMPMHNTTFMTDLKMGFSAKAFPHIGGFDSDFPLNWVGTYSESKVKHNGPVFTKAYGYMNSENANAYDLKDFSLTPISYNKKLPHLSPSNVTYDVFSIAGQGTGGAYRGHRADIGVFSQKKTTSLTEQHRLSLDVGVAVPVPPLNVASCAISYHVGIGGVPPTIGIAEDRTGAWESGLGAVASLSRFVDPASKRHLYDEEVKFYKDIGDRPAILGTNSMYDVWKGEQPVKLDISDYSTVDIRVQGVSGGVNTNASDFSERTRRTPRTRVIQSLDGRQAQDYGVSSTYQYFNQAGQSVSKFAAARPSHHKSEISVLEPDGMRYIYGMPAYNNTQEDVSFSTLKNTGDLSVPNPVTSVLSNSPIYTQANGEWSKQPEFLDKTTLPAYAHAWMLTSVVSADYVDVTGDGLTSDDLGYWVDFKYQKTANAYRWRAPYQGAVYSPGTTQDFDDKASYSTGTKELFYLKEIRTKTHVAIYELENRNDAIGAGGGINGGKPSSIGAENRMKKLKSIKLYTIDEYKTANPEPLKTVHFEYTGDTDTETLCKKVPNQATPNGGKLTLKKVYFTYGKSNKGRLSPYVFNYDNANPTYNLKQHDCWGNYQDNSLANYPYHEFPYTNQNPNTSHQVPWHLTSINLPTGGTLKIEYEQDDYAYVEDKKAMQLYDIVYTGKEGDFNNLSAANFSQRGTAISTAHQSSLKNYAHDNATGDVLAPDFKYRIYFPLKTPVPDATNPTASDFYGTTATIYSMSAWFKSHYIGETKDLYFKAAVKLLNDPTGNSIRRNSDKVDFVGGYAELRTDMPLEHYGLAKSPNAATGEYDMGYITVKPVSIKAFGAGKDVIHPIRDAALQHLRFSRSELVHGTQSVSGFLGLFSVVPDILTSMMGYKYAYKTQGWGAGIFLDGFSQIRLLVPDGKKIGGGVRVKKLILTDNWKAMTKDHSGASDYKNGTYGQIYSYTIEEGGATISSGVAYEPYAGKEQNPLVTPIRYEHSNPLQNPNNFFLENPIMMRHYPGASVGYRKVTVQSISAEDDSYKRGRAPYTEYEFYSPKAFPVKVEKTTMSKTGAHYDILPIPGIYTKFKRAEGASQGYTIIFNDMAGKIKSVTQKTYDNPANNYEATVVSRQAYEYFTKDDGSLLNEVDVFTSNGRYEKAKLGIDYDIQIEMNEHKQSANNFTLDFNLDAGMITIPVGPVCIPFPMIASGGISTTSSSLKTAVVQKFVNKSGLLKSTTVTNQSSTITTENLVFDKMTGEPLLTKTENEFHDNIYAYTQKAYWEYDGMSEAFRNIGAILNGPYSYQTSSNWQGTYEIGNVGGWSEFPLVEGDEVFLEGSDLRQGIKATVFTVATNGGKKYVAFSQQDGTVVNAATIGKITITRSGRRNLLAASIGSMAAMDLRYQPNTSIGAHRNLTMDHTSKVLNASAVTYRDYWPTGKHCEVIDYCHQSACLQLPFPAINRTNFKQKMDDRTILLKLNGQPLTSSDVEVPNNCSNVNTVTHTMCTGTTDPNYTVRIRRPGNVVETPAFTNLGTGNCTIPGTGTLTIPCGPYQSIFKLTNGTHEIRVTGGIFNDVLWPLSKIQQTTGCQYALGRWQLELPRAPVGVAQPGDHVLSSINCMTMHPNIIDYYFDWQVPNAGISVHVPWTNLAFYSFGNWNVSPKAQLLSHLNSLTGPQDWAIRGSHITGLMTAAEANKMVSARLGLVKKEKWGSLFGALVPVSYCYNNAWSQPPYNFNLQPKMWYNFEYDVFNCHGFDITGLNAGTSYIVHYKTQDGGINLYSGTATATPIRHQEVQIQLPANEQVTIEIVSNGSVVRSEVFPATPPPSSGVQVDFLTIPVGTNQLEVWYDNNLNDTIPAVLQESKVFECDKDNVQSSVLVCADGSTQNVNWPTYNSYQKGSKGRWRPWASYTYVSNRYYGDTTNPNPSIREQGVYQDFSPFSWQNSSNNSAKWQWAARAIKYAPGGYEVETVDALGNYSAALYDYKDNLATAVAQNARYHEIMYDGFENHPKSCNSHTYLTDAQTVHNTHSHTGDHSYKVTRNSHQKLEPIVLGGVNEIACANKLVALDSAKYNRQDILDFLNKGKETPNMKIPKIMRTSTAASDNSMVEVLPAECGCLGKFAPDQGKKYHINMWMKRAMSRSLVTYGNFYVHVNFKDAGENFIGSPVVLMPKGSMVEKWQRITGDFVIPANASTMHISFRNENTGSIAEDNTDVYIDDLRILPYEANMNTYVYDKTTLRNTATLDDNNFATFYIYDEEGKLIKTKKETLEGIKTINEGRQHVRGPLNQ